MIIDPIIFYITIAILALVVAGLVYALVILNSSKYETKREFEIKQNQKIRKGKK